jgi:hypothetical protein
MRASGIVIRIRCVDPNNRAAWAAYFKPGREGCGMVERFS